MYWICSAFPPDERGEGQQAEPGGSCRKWASCKDRCSRGEAERRQQHQQVKPTEKKKTFDLSLFKRRLPHWCEGFLSNPPLPQVSQHTGFSYLRLGGSRSRKEQEQVCSLQRLCAHLAAQGTNCKFHSSRTRPSQSLPKQYLLQLCHVSFVSEI